MTRIEAVELREIVIPFRSTFRSSAGELNERRLLLLRLHAGGNEGWGECGPIPGYGTDTYAAARNGLAAAAGQLVGRDIPDDGWRGLFLAEIPSPSARFTVECALEDLAGHLGGRPVWPALGGRDPKIPVGAVIPAGPIDDVAAAAAAAAAAGYRRVKLNVTSTTDLGLVKAVAAAIPDTDLAIDANGAFAAVDLSALEAIDALGLCFFEQPFPADDTTSSIELARRIETPICLDESITSPEAARGLLDAGACSMVVVKPARLGGFEASRELLETAMATGTGAWVGGMLESGIGRAAALAVARLPGTTAPADLAPPHRLLADDLLSTSWTFSDGFIEVPERPGLGFNVDIDAVERFCVEANRYG